MRAVVQRVSKAEVGTGSEIVASIAGGLCVLLAVGPNDTEAVARHFAQRVASLRIFPDGDGKMNLDARAVDAHILVVSQFTLYADVSRGHRPSFTGAAAPELAVRLCDEFAAAVRSLGLPVSTGQFGAHMEVALTNDGPVTIVLSSGEPYWAADAG